MRGTCKTSVKAMRAQLKEQAPSQDIFGILAGVIQVGVKSSHLDGSIYIYQRGYPYLFKKEEPEIGYMSACDKMHFLDTMGDN